MLNGRSGKIKMIIALVAAVLVLLAGVAIIMTRSPGKDGAKEEKHEEPPEMMALGSFVVNLANTDTVRYAKADIVLAYHGELELGGGGHGGHGGGDDNSKAPIRDAVIKAISSKTFEDLAKPGGKEELKKEICEAVNERLEGAEAVYVYFNEFAMQ